MRDRVDVAAVSEALRNLIETSIQGSVDFGDTHVTVQHPGAARALLTSNQVNLFLYQVLSGTPPPNNAAIAAPLNLQLCYLITAYGRDDDQFLEQRLLGNVIGILHDNPVLTVNQIAPAQRKIAWQPIPIEVLSDLWVAFQTAYRVSAAYRIFI